jgi:hypothetical protein
VNTSHPTRIASIELRDFRAYPGGDPGTVIPTTDEKGQGKNLLLYGENGSGKSSLGKALRDFLDIRLKAPQFDEFRHTFTKPPDPKGNVTILFDDSTIPPLQWIPTGRERNHKEFSDMARTRGWLDYRAVWRATEVGVASPYVEVFGPLVDEILPGCEMPAQSESFGKIWHRIVDMADKRPRRTYWERADVEKLTLDISSFNVALKAFLPELEKQANEFLPFFVPWTELKLLPLADAAYNSSKRRDKFSRGTVAMRMIYRGEWSFSRFVSTTTRSRLYVKICRIWSLRGGFSMEVI